MFKKIGQSSTGVFITYILKTILLIVFARLISPVEYGVFAATMVIVNLAERFTDFGFGPALVQRKDISEIHVNTSFTTSFCLGLSLTCLTFFGAGFLSRITGVPATYEPIRAMSIIFLIDSIYSSAYALLQRDLDFGFIIKIDIFSYLIGSGIIGLTIALLGGGVWALVAAEVAEPLIACSMALYKKRTPYKFTINKVAFKHLFNFGFGQTFYQLVLYFVQQSDNFIVGRYMGAKKLGIYSRAYALLVLPSRLFGLAAGRVIFPSMAKFQDDIDKFRQVFLKLIEFLAILSFPLMGFLTIACTEFVKVVLGNQWLSLVPILQVFTFSMFFRLVFSVNNIVLKAAGKIYYTAYIQILTLILIVTGCLLLYPYGLVAIGIAVSFALFVQCVILTYALIKYSNSSWKEVGSVLQYKLLLNIVFASVGFGLKLFLLHLNCSYVFIFISLIIFYCLCMLATIQFFPKVFFGSMLPTIIQIKLFLRQKFNLRNG